MAVKTCCPEIRLKQPDVGMCKRGEDEEKDYLQQFPCCPACNQGYGVALILPCSHPMCGRCVAAGAETRSCRSVRRGPHHSACSVLCPCCRCPVELPCRTRSSATSCLPKYPTLRSECGKQEADIREGSSPEEQLQHVQEPLPLSPHDPGSTGASSSITPMDVTVDLQEEEMEQSVYGLHFALDPSTVHASLQLSNSSLTVTFHEETLPAPPPENKISKARTSTDPEAFPHVCGDVVIARGQYYWEVDVCNSSLYRIGVMSLDGSNGWWLQRHSSSFFVMYDGSSELLRTVPPQIKTLGVFLNVGGGTLSFHNPLTQEHLATLPTRFSPAGVLPALGLGQGRLRLRSGLPPPPHVFFSKDSAYRGPRRSRRGQWRSEVPFQSVREAIQKFEKLALPDSDSSFGLPCSTLASPPDVGTFPSGKALQETGPE